jgi:tetratricopeptide (TPR) repeat protein
MAEFERSGLDGTNRMDIAQISDAATSSSFESSRELGDWLRRAFGPDIKLLQLALRHTHRTVQLCPLQGEGYVYLADLCFFDQAPRETTAAFVDQALRVRPYDRNVLYRAGRQELLSGRNEAAIEFWSRCFNTPGPHQQQIVFRLVYSGMPARMLLDKFKPEWHTLLEVWEQYRQSGTPQDLADLRTYAVEAAPQEIAKENSAVRPASIWYRLAAMHADVGRVDESLACLERAYASDTTQYAVRYALGKALIAVGRLPEAEPHVRWCLARRPGDKNLTAALLAISKHRLAMRTTTRPEAAQIPAVQPFEQRPFVPPAVSAPAIQQ